MSLARKGRRPWNKGISMREETKVKLREARKKQVITKETGQKISKALKGRPNFKLRGKKLSMKRREQISLATSGKNNPMYGKSAIKGRKWYNNGTFESLYHENQQPKDWILGRIRMQEVVL